MSAAPVGSEGGNGNDTSGAPRLSRHSRSFIHKKLQKGAKKEGDDRKGYQYSSKQRSLQCLTTFDCPVCRLKNSVRVDLNTKERQAVVRCTYCMSVRPRPRDLPYPFTTPFVPKLENRADVFFKFNELYRGLEKQSLPISANTLENNNDMEMMDNIGNYSGDGVLAISSTILSGGVVANHSNSNSCGGSEEEEEENDDDKNSETSKVQNDSDKAENNNSNNNNEVEDVHAFFGDSDDD